MKNPRTMKIKTPIGNLMVEIGETEFSYYAAVALARDDGEVIDLTECGIMKGENNAEICVWNDTQTDVPSHQFSISKVDLMIEVE